MSESISDVVSTTSAELVGVWVHDPTDPAASLRSFLHTTSRSDALTIGAERIRVHGRRRAIAEFGDQLDDGVNVGIFVPFGTDHDGLVQYWRDVVLNRRAICYRDNRGRVVFGTLLDGVEPTDERAGTSLDIKLTAVDYTPDA